MTNVICRKVCTPALVALVAGTLLSSAARGAEIDAFWLGGTGAWNLGSAWDINQVPNNGANTYNVFIDGGNAAVSDVTLNMLATVSSLTIDADDSLAIANGQRLRIAAGAINNSGTLILNSNGSNTYIHPLAGPVTLMGGGELVLSDFAENWIYRDGTGGSFVNVDNTIRGAGHIGWASVSTQITNGGLIVADGTNPLDINTGTQTFTNDGTVRAESGATLSLSASSMPNSNGTIEALDGSFVTLNAITILGGTLQTGGSGVIESGGSSVLLDGTVNAVTNAGVLRAPNNTRLRAKGALHNTGNIEISSTGSATHLHPQDEALTLTGGGTVLMSASAQNWIYRDGANGSLVNMDNTIRGAGHLGWNSVPMPITNHGTVIADTTSPLDVATGAEVFTNTGEMRAENGATLALSSGLFENHGGTIAALDASKVTLGSVTIAGGDLQTSGSGAFESVGSTALLDGTVNAVTNSGLLRVPNNTRIKAKGTLHNTGTIEISSTGSATYLHPQDEVLTLTGGGTVVMTDSTNNWIYRDGPGSLVNMDNTIRGAGHLGWNSAPMPITNQGTVIADTTSPLDVAAGSSVFTNTGEMRAENGATLALSSGLFENHGGTIAAMDASKVTLASVTIAGGDLETSGSGAFEAVGSTALLDGTVNAVTNSGLLRVPNSTRIKAKGTLHNTGTIEISSTGSATYLHPQDEVLTLTGGGTVVMTDSTNNWIYRDGPGSLLNVDNTIRGAGHIGWSSAPTEITNQGAIIADQVTQLIIGGGSALFDNQGQLSATGAGGLRIEGSFTNSGDVLVGGGSSLTRIGAYTQTGGSTIVNGTMSATGGLSIEGGVLGGSGTISSAVQNSGSAQPGESAGILSINAAYTQTPSGELFIEIGGTTAGMQHDRLAVSGGATLGGLLRVGFIDDYDPVVGDVFTIMTYASKTGAFDAFDAPCLGDGRFVQIDVLPTSVVARISDAMAGDVTCDCALTLDDAAALALALTDADAYLAAYPACNGLESADINGDGQLNGHDIQPFVENYLP